MPDDARRLTLGYIVPISISAAGRRSSVMLDGKLTDIYAVRTYLDAQREEADGDVFQPVRSIRIVID